MNTPTPTRHRLPTHARLCAVLTCHDRRESTLACLAALRSSAAAAGVPLAAVLVDDGSLDGTREAVAAAFPWVTVIVGPGDLFWCRGMHRAFGAALATGYEHYLWLNDDTMLEPDAVARLFACLQARMARTAAPCIVVGACVHPETGRPTYGGERIPSRWRPLQTALLAPGDIEQRCDSMTGNIVLIPADAAARVGNIDGAFEHAMGDTDYALRARRAGVEVWLAPGVLGRCADNPVQGGHLDPRLPLRRRWRTMLSRKGLPWRSWLRFTRRHGGVLWPLRFVAPYLKVLLGGLTSRGNR